MSYWSIVLPEATTNYVRNPSFGDNVTTEWAKISGTDATRVTTHRMFGLASMALTAAANPTDTAYRSDTVFSLPAGSTVTASAYAYRATSTPTCYIGIRDVTTSNTTRATDTIAITAQWERLSCSWTNSTGGAVDIRVLLVNNTRDGASIVYFDGVQAEIKTAATTYCDGGQEGCAWNGLPNNATSTRDASSRAGGSIVDLSAYSMYVERVGTGLGMPTMRHVTSPYALQPGALFQRRTVEPQTLEMTIIAIGTSRNNLHSIRKQLINALKPDLVKDDPAFAIQYQGALSTKLPVELQVRYDSGLEWQHPDGFTEYIPLRLIAYDPFWHEQGNDAAEIAYGATNDITTAYIAQMDIPSGVWSSVGDGALDGTVRTLMVGASGYWLYAGGDFENFGATACNYIARLDRGAGTWSTMGATAGTNDVVRCLAQTADGYVYAGGDFTTAGGTTVNYIGRWNGTAWAAMGATAGTNGGVYALRKSARRYLLVGGAFTTAGGATANRIARWSGSAWSTFGGGIPDSGTVYTIGSVYGGDNFITVGGSFATTYDYGAYWNEGVSPSAWTSLFNDDLNGNVRAIIGNQATYYPGIFLRFHANGNIYDAYSVRAGGLYWGETMGAGLGAAGHCGVVHPTSGDLYVGGAFTTAGGASAPYLAKWNGSVWSGLNVVLPGSPTVTAMDISPDGNTLYVGFNTSGAIGSETIPGSTTVTNLGTATAYPVIKIKRSGGTSATLRYIQNATQSCTIYSGYALQDGETLIIDLTDKTVTSDFDGTSVIGQAIERNSDFGRWGILPGVNEITTLVETVGSPTVTAWLEWRTTHWSADGAAA